MLPENSKLKIYNALSNSLEEFKPITDNEVVMYVCGPTVYNYIHIGNARPIVFFDVVHRYFKLLGYNVKFISNFTDIDDKIINRAVEEGVTEAQIASKYIDAYNADWRSLHALDVDVRCKVTDYLTEITSFIKQLVDDNKAYQVGSDVYFKVDEIKEYGMLSNNKLDALNAGERISVNNAKKHPMDFTLWKETDKGITYDSPFGKGRPGWHTECVVMIKSLTDGLIDIHGGGQDLCFPHHENEIAQSLAYDKKQLANYWMHNGMLNLNNSKMSKSLGNVLLTKDFIKQYSGNVLRLALLQTHYRSEINFNDDLVSDTVKLDEKIFNVYKKLALNFQLSKEPLSPARRGYLPYINDDFNTANVITYLLELLKEINVALRNNQDGLELFSELKEVIYLLGVEYDYPTLTDEDVETYLQWLEYRSNKDFDNADKLRAVLEEKRII